MTIYTKIRKYLRVFLRLFGKSLINFVNESLYYPNYKLIQINVGLLD